MSRLWNVLVVVLVAGLGLWGCTQSPSAQSSGSAERIKSLEREIAQLQESYKSVSSIRDQLRKSVAEKDEQRLQLQSELDQLQTSAGREREELTAQLTTRTTERDAALVQFEQFRKGVRSLLVQADAASSPAPTTPVLTLTEPAMPESTSSN